MPNTVVHLNGQSAIDLRVEEMVDGEVPGSKVARQIGEILLKPGRNDVDDALWAKWTALNPNSPMLASGVLHEEKEETDDQKKPDSGQ